jgi:integral membrane sensor domain MASE1
VSRWFTLVGIVASFISTFFAHGFLTLAKQVSHCSGYPIVITGIATYVTDFRCWPARAACAALANISE